MDDTWFEEIFEVGCQQLFEFLDDDDEIDSVLFCGEGDIPAKKAKIRKKRTYIDREFQRFNDILIEDYFCSKPRYSEDTFRRRFRMPKQMFLRICEDLSYHNEYFTQRTNAAGRTGLSTIQKCTAAIRLLAYGMAADTLDEYLKIGEKTALDTLREFCESICKTYGEFYLRAPNENDVKKLLIENEKRGFPGMLGSIDRYHWDWKNCPVAFQGQYVGKSKSPTVVLEAITSYNLHIWHCYFGIPGSCNDINIIDRSPIQHHILQDEMLKAHWCVDGRTRERGYWLADGIYPDWPIFLKTIFEPKNSKEQYFAKMQESTRKDVERGFGVLIARWHILCNPCRLWDVYTISIIMKTCIILHNMILEYETDEEIKTNASQEDSSSGETFDPTLNHTVDAPAPGSLAYILRTRAEIKDFDEFSALREDLVAHLWNMKGNK